MAPRMATTATTTISSIRVKPDERATLMGVVRLLLGMAHLSPGLSAFPHGAGDPDAFGCRPAGAGVAHPSVHGTDALDHTIFRIGDTGPGCPPGVSLYAILGVQVVAVGEHEIAVNIEVR